MGGRVAQAPTLVLREVEARAPVASQTDSGWCGARGQGPRLWPFPRGRHKVSTAESGVCVGDGARKPTQRLRLRVHVGTVTRPPFPVTGGSVIPRLAAWLPPRDGASPGRQVGEWTLGRWQGSEHTPPHGAPGLLNTVSGRTLRPSCLPEGHKGLLGGVPLPGLGKEQLGSEDRGTRRGTGKSRPRSPTLRPRFTTPCSGLSYPGFPTFRCHHVDIKHTVNHLLGSLLPKAPCHVTLTLTTVYAFLL